PRTLGGGLRPPSEPPPRNRLRRRSRRSKRNVHRSRYFPWPCAVYSDRPLVEMEVGVHVDVTEPGGRRRHHTLTTQRPGRPAISTPALRTPERASRATAASTSARGTANSRESTAAVE